MSSACKRLIERATITAQPFPVCYLLLKDHQYGSAIFVKANSVLEASSVSSDDDIEVLSVELSSVVVTSIYKPPAVDYKFPHSIPQVPGKPQIIIGDFNSHSTQWAIRKQTKMEKQSRSGWTQTNLISSITPSYLRHSMAPIGDVAITQI